VSSATDRAVTTVVIREPIAVTGRIPGSGGGTAGDRPSLEDFSKQPSRDSLLERVQSGPSTSEIGQQFGLSGPVRGNPFTHSSIPDALSVQAPSASRSSPDQLSAPSVEDHLGTQQGAPGDSRLMSGDSVKTTVGKIWSWMLGDKEWKDNDAQGSGGVRGTPNPNDDSPYPDQSIPDIPKYGVLNNKDSGLQKSSPQEMIGGNSLNPSADTVTASSFKPLPTAQPDRTSPLIRTTGEEETYDNLPAPDIQGRPSDLISPPKHPWE
jgi:hypothetical protein